MAINYNLSIGNVTKKFTVGEFSNVIVSVNIAVSAYSDAVTETDSDGNTVVKSHPLTYSCGSVIDLDVENLSQDNFIDFNSITKETIIGWLLQSEGVNSIEEYSYVKYSIENIQRRLDEMLDQETVVTNWNFSNDITSGEVDTTETTEDPSVLEA